MVAALPTTPALPEARREQDTSEVDVRAGPCVTKGYLPRDTPNPCFDAHVEVAIFRVGSFQLGGPSTLSILRTSQIVRTIET